MPLLDTLKGITHSRRTLVRRSIGRKDWHDLNHACDLATAFLRSYPVATDERVVEWCRKNEHILDRLLTSKQRPTLKPLLMGMKP
jgi:hypothetical protein